MARHRAVVTPARDVITSSRNENTPVNLAVILPQSRQKVRIRRMSMAPLMVGPLTTGGSGHPWPKDRAILTTLLPALLIWHHGQANQPTSYGNSMYPYHHHQLQQSHGPTIPPFYLEHHHGHHPHHPPSSHNRADGHSPGQHPVPHPHAFQSHSPSPYGGPPLSPHDLIPYQSGGYYQLREPYNVVSGMMPPYFNPYPRVPSPSQVESSGSPPPAPVDAAKDEAIARLEKLILEERTEREAREAREAARQAAIEQEAIEQAAREERAAHEKRIVEEAAAKARAEAEQKAAEEAAKAKLEAEEAAAAAASEAAAAATEAANQAAAEAVAAATAAASNKSVPEKKKPIKFKDAVGRKFSFPFELCCTWQVWETVIEPDWAITMHMWPIPEKPKTPEPPPPPEPPVSEEPAVIDVPAAPEDAAVAPVVEETKKKADPAGTKKPRAKAPDPGAFAMWMVGSNRLRLNKALKVGKKPRVIQQHANTCRVM
ncbi:hypothetical protein N8T08_010018 [Aspergillus melleus]|uniref:Uncharacterized protein n=1 Tax=Aspergillus melleus TaxID=138277 RepID=A0ACC3ASV6_9EURO|nr:hypothetical protein N8T08_010018 [Aspergillus melleus]